MAFSVVDSFDQAISISYRLADFPEEMLISCVHGSNLKGGRRILGERLLAVQSDWPLPWLCGGDFNTI